MSSCVYYVIKFYIIIYPIHVKSKEILNFGLFFVVYLKHVLLSSIVVIFSMYFFCFLFQKKVAGKVGNYTKFYNFIFRASPIRRSCWRLCSFTDATAGDALTGRPAYAGAFRFPAPEIAVKRWCETKLHGPIFIGSS